MLRYVNRTKEVYQKLKGCAAQREVYDAIDFNRPPHSNISNGMTHTQLSVLSGTARQRILIVLGQLMEKGLIQQVLTQKKYVFQYLLVDQSEAEVVAFSATEDSVESQPEQDQEQEQVTDNPEPKRGFLGGILE